MPHHLNAPCILTLCAALSAGCATTITSRDVGNGFVGAGSVVAGLGLVVLLPACMEGGGGSSADGSHTAEICLAATGGTIGVGLLTAGIGALIISVTDSFRAPPEESPTDEDDIPYIRKRIGE